jgi:hypothetical protein
VGGVEVGDLHDAGPHCAYPVPPRARG